MRGVFLNLNDLCTGVLCYVPGFNSATISYAFT